MTTAFDHDAPSLRPTQPDVPVRRSVSVIYADVAAAVPTELAGMDNIGAIWHQLTPSERRGLLEVAAAKGQRRRRLRARTARSRVPMTSRGTPLPPPPRLVWEGQEPPS
jgi:hypothetical protein